MQLRTAKSRSIRGRALNWIVAHLAMVVVLTATGAAVLPQTTVAQEGSGDGAAKVVYHVDFKDPRRFSAMLTTIYNMVSIYQNDLREYDVRIVFHSYGVRFLTDNKLEGTPFEADKALEERRENLKGRLMSLQDVYDVGLELCEITREHVGLSRDNVYEGVKAVGSGVVRIAELDSKGFAYIKIE